MSHVVAVAAGVGILTLFAARSWPPPRHWKSVLIGSQTRTSFTICAAFWGSGLLFTLTGLPFHRHYLIVAFPLVSAWLAVMAIGVRPDRARWRREGRALLLAVWGCCLVVSVCFLHYIHMNEGAPRGDYGLAYSVRLKQQPPPPAPGATAR